MSFLNQVANNVVPTGVGLAILLELALKGIAVVTVAVCLVGIIRKSSAANKHLVRSKPTAFGRATLIGSAGPA